MLMAGDSLHGRPLPRPRLHAPGRRLGPSPASSRPPHPPGRRHTGALAPAAGQLRPRGHRGHDRGLGGDGRGRPARRHASPSGTAGLGARPTVGTSWTPTSQLLTSEGAEVVWIGMPPSREPDAQLEWSSDEPGRASASPRRPTTCTWIPGDEILANPDGSWADILPGPQGNPQRVRRIDTTHLCAEGAVRLARPVLNHLRRPVGRPPRPGLAHPRLALGLPARGLLPPPLTATDTAPRVSRTGGSARARVCRRLGLIAEQRSPEPKSEGGRAGRG